MIVKDYPTILSDLSENYPKTSKSDKVETLQAIDTATDTEFQKVYPIFYPKRVLSDNIVGENYPFDTNDLQREKVYPISPTPKGGTLRFQTRSRPRRGFMGEISYDFMATEKNGGVGG